MPRTTARQPDGFTILEVLLVVAGLAIAAGVLVLVYNPGRRLADTRNSQRRSDVAQILNAVYQYKAATGELPEDISSAQTEICITGASTCEGLVDLSVLTKSQAYLAIMPSDPTGASTNGAGYEIVATNGHIMVVAPDAENGATVSSAR